MLQVAVGVVKNSAGQILISLRGSNLHQGGLWEFPGGKVESGETAYAALVRELNEELGITVQSAQPLIDIKHNYPDLAVQLLVYKVDRFCGEVTSCEGQPFLWVNPDDLGNYDFPEANRPIVSAARLPDCYAILDDAQPDLLLPNLKTMLNNGIRLVQARLKTLSAQHIMSFIDQAYPLCKSYNAALLLNSSCAIGDYGEVDGVHLTAQQLMSVQQRPANKGWLAASCHNVEELHHAQQIGVDFVVLAPVLPTSTHPGAKPLGWPQFAELVSQVNIPVYALGGLSRDDVIRAQKYGAQGIAGIRAFL